MGIVASGDSMFGLWALKSLALLSLPVMRVSGHASRDNQCLSTYARRLTRCNNSSLFDQAVNGVAMCATTFMLLRRDIHRSNVGTFPPYQINLVDQGRMGCIWKENIPHQCLWTIESSRLSLRIRVGSCIEQYLHHLLVTTPDAV